MEPDNQGGKEAAALLDLYAQRCKTGSFFGSMSPSIYDTAWVSMVSKKSNHDQEWLFPHAFEHLLSQQQPDGGWEAYADPVDGILNTMAALLAMLKHRQHPSPNEPHDLDSRIRQGESCLRDRLSEWNAQDCDHVGFEILVPSHLRLLQEYGLGFDFPAAEYVEALNRGKMARFDPCMLYMPASTTMVHSLEAFVGQLDFGRARCNLVHGSMMASPASTAAYLMSLSDWDNEAESYLRRIAAQSTGDSFPSAFPTSVFEASWVLSTLLEHEASFHALPRESVQALSDFLASELSRGQGVVGFAPGLPPDADDTAKALHSLACAGQATDPQGLVRTFYNGRHFTTYRTERNPSISTNCNALKALLSSQAPSKYADEVASTVAFLCDAWRRNSLKDKWNLSDLYSAMLLSQAFVQLLKHHDSAGLPEMISHIALSQIPITLAQIQSKILLQQDANGAWGDNCAEVTAYGILALIAVGSLPWAQAIRDNELAIDRARAFLLQRRTDWARPSYVWIEKVTYAIPNLTKAYCLAAMSAQIASHAWSAAIRSTVSVPAKSALQFERFFSRIPLFEHRARRSELIQTSLVEGYALYPQLKHASSSIFPREGMSEDRYLEYIPFIWASCRNLSWAIDGNVLKDMVLLSMYNFQVDEYMESVIRARPAHDLEKVELLIRRLCAFREPTVVREGSESQLDSEADLCAPSGDGNGFRRAPSGSPSLQDVGEVLEKYVSHVLQHPKVVQSPPATCRELHKRLQSFLLAHVAQIRYSARLSEQAAGRTDVQPWPSYYDWVHTTSADHTSCPFSFLFYCCLISSEGKDCFTTAKQKYFAQDVCQHLSTMCRQYNDYGSVARDREESNLNSVDFDEFDGGDKGAWRNEAPASHDTLRKEQLMALAEYERECLEAALARLERESPAAVMQKLRVLVDVTDLFGQIYVTRDIASRVEQRGTNAYA